MVQRKNWLEQIRCRLFREVRGKKYKPEHYELCAYNYSDSCEIILWEDTDEELMMDIKNHFLSWYTVFDSNGPELAKHECEQGNIVLIVCTGFAWPGAGSRGITGVASVRN